MERPENNTDFQKRSIKSFMKVEVIPDDSMKHPNRKKPEYVPYPSSGGYAVSKNGAILQFDFCDSEMNYEIIGDDIFCDIEQYSLDLDCYKESWVENGLIEELILDEQLESAVFEIIREANEVHEIYIEMWDERKDEHYNCKMIIHEFVLIDVNSGEQIDLMKYKTFAEDCFPENVSI